MENDSGIGINMNDQWSVGSLFAMGGHRNWGNLASKTPEYRMQGRD